MAPTSVREEYAELMKRNGDGHYLYTPIRYSLVHPGSVGYFDNNGAWTQITDLSEKGRPEKDGFTGVDDELPLDEPSESMWKTVSSGSEAESSFGLNAGLSGLVSAAPVDVEANAKNKSGSTGKAALITTEVVKNRRFTGQAGPSIAAWVKANAKTLVKSKYGDYIKQYGLWAIHTTWSTQECAITMDSAHSRDTSGGLDVGATGVGKLGASGSSLKKLESKGWRTYEAKESDQGLVVSYAGAGFRLHSIQIFRSKNPLKQTERAAATETLMFKPIYDEEGNQIGGDYYRPVYDENGKHVGEEKVDHEAERKKKEAENKAKAEEDQEEEDEEISISCDPVGISEADLGIDTKAFEESTGLRVVSTVEDKTPEEKEAMKKDVEIKKEEIMKIPDEEQRRAELIKLYQSNVVNVTTTYERV